MMVEESSIIAITMLPDPPRLGSSLGKTDSWKGLRREEKGKRSESD
jgi:hypothetical protein